MGGSPKVTDPMGNETIYAYDGSHLQFGVSRQKPKTKRE